MGAANSGYWTVSPDCTTLRDPGTSRVYDALVRQAISVHGLGLRRRCTLLYIVLTLVSKDSWETALTR